MDKSVTVSIVSFNGIKYLRRCMDCVFSQSYKALDVHVLDNASSDGTAEFVGNNYPEASVVSSPVNLGFAAGHNKIIHLTRSPFILVLNQDAFLSPTFIEELVSSMAQHPDVGIAGGKLYSSREYSIDECSDVIDMTWLDIEKKRRQVCYAQGKPDTGLPRVPTFAFAMDGAAMLLRRSMLLDIRVGNEFFDEDFFAGKEDLDLSWRAQLLGWKCLYVPSAVGHHKRTFTPRDKRSDIVESLRTASIRNRYLLMIKNDLLDHLLKHLVAIVLYDIKIMAYVLFREQSSLKAYMQVYRLLPRAVLKRKIIMRRRKAHDAYMLSWFR
jgi:GT2 family glycosyltransferase